MQKLLYTSHFFIAVKGKNIYKIKSYGYTSLYIRLCRKYWCQKLDYFSAKQQFFYNYETVKLVKND
jgi:hypothetical protein